MSKKIKIFCLLILIIIIGLFIYKETKKSTEYICKTNIILADKGIEIMVAKTQKQRQLGLSGTMSLKDNEGMLFVFSKEDKHNFWMKDMNYPIDIIWFDENNNISFVKENFLPESFPENVGPNKKGKYVLEVPAFYSKKNNLKIGDHIYIPKYSCI